jgi:hypothetical protein
VTAPGENDEEMTAPRDAAWHPTTQRDVAWHPTTQRDAAWQPRIVAEDDQVILDEPASDPASALAADIVPQTTPAAAEELGEPALSGTASEQPVASADDAASSPTASAPDAEAAAVSTSPGARGDTEMDARWHEILATFVDDPRSSVELAAGLADDRAEVLVLSIRERQHALLSAWQGDDTGTEQLRLALQQYRAFCSRLEDHFGRD